MWLNKKKRRQEHLEGKVVTICKCRGGSHKFNIGVQDAYPASNLGTGILGENTPILWLLD